MPNGVYALTISTSLHHYPSWMHIQGTTYQRKMNKIFEQEIGDMFKVYIDSIIVKSDEEKLYEAHLTIIFNSVRQFNICLKLG